MPETIDFPSLSVVNLAADGGASSAPDRNVELNRVNDSCLRLATFEVEYRWHFHPDSDELFIVVDGILEIDFVNAPTLQLTTWDMITIPAGTVHRTRARGRTVNLTFEHLDAATTFVDDPR
jgi:mannose-6-phosphate isomerase-like protein (cupin superfamily)